MYHYFCFGRSSFEKRVETMESSTQLYTYDAQINDIFFFVKKFEINFEDL